MKFKIDSMANKGSNSNMHETRKASISDIFCCQAFGQNGLPYQ